MYRSLVTDVEKLVLTLLRWADVKMPKPFMASVPIRTATASAEMAATTMINVQFQPVGVTRLRLGNINRKNTHSNIPCRLLAL